MSNIWFERLTNSEKFGFCVSETKDSFGYSFPSKATDKIMIKCCKCSNLNSWGVGDFYRKIMQQNKPYKCHSCKKYTLEEIQQQLDLKFGSGLITIAPNQVYLGIRKPLIFIDRDYGEWSVAPFNVLTNGNTHPKRSSERRKQTNLDRYGHENCFGSDVIKEKIKNTNMKNHGVENPMHREDVKEKLRNTFTDKYGCPVPLVGDTEVRRRSRETNLKRYGRELYANVTHDKSDSLEYRSWVGMKSRCYNENDTSYSDYGGRGITVCDEWLASFEKFYNDLGDMPKDNQRYSLDRIDYNKGYSPDNCKWATYSEQANNKRNNIRLTYMGRTQTLAQWSEELGLNQVTVWDRLNKHGWSIERALSTPSRNKHKS